VTVLSTVIWTGRHGFPGQEFQHPWDFDAFGPTREQLNQASRKLFIYVNNRLEGNALLTIMATIDEPDLGRWSRLT
jgi:hypothetical protein